MIITTAEELRFFFPNHAIDNIEGIQGSIYNSEHDFLEEKLGTSLYDALCSYYKATDKEALLETMGDGTDRTPMGQLLLAAQRAVAFDAMARTVSIRAISDNGAGVNVATSDGYDAADDKAKQDYKAACIKEAHSSINIMLQMLERWCKKANTTSAETAESDEIPTDGSSSETVDKELTEAQISELWHQSRYYYLCTMVLLPTAEDMQQYLNIYDSREKFILMLPDMRYVEEEMIETAVGETFAQWLCLLCVQGIPTTTDKKSTLLLQRIIHRSRKAFAAYVEERTAALKTTDKRRIDAHNEGEKHINAVVELLRLHQSEVVSSAAAIDALAASLDTTDMPESFYDAVTNAPWYVADSTATDSTPEFENNQPGNAMFVTPAMD